MNEQHVGGEFRQTWVVDKDSSRQENWSEPTHKGDS